MLILRKALSLACLLALTGCGTFVPSIGEPDDHSLDHVDKSGLLEAHIKEVVFCELHRAVMHAKDPDPTKRVHQTTLDKNGKPHDVVLLPDDWGVQGTINLEVDELTGLNALAAPVTPLIAAQSFTMGLGGTVSTQANRIDKFGFYYDIRPLSRLVTPLDPCFEDPNTGEKRMLHYNGGSFLLESDLGIDQWLQNALQVEAVDRSSPITAKSDGWKQDYLSYEIKFIVTTSGSVNPSWKLTRITTNSSGSPFFNTSRTRSHDLLLTFGPQDKPTDTNPPTKKHGAAIATNPPATGNGPSQSALNAHIASEIGLAVANAIHPTVP